MREFQSIATIGNVRAFVRQIDGIEHKAPVHDGVETPLQHAAVSLLDHIVHMLEVSKYKLDAGTFDGVVVPPRSQEKLDDLIAHVASTYGLSADQVDDLIKPYR